MSFIFRHDHFWLATLISTYLMISQICLKFLVHLTDWNKRKQASLSDDAGVIFSDTDFTWEIIMPKTNERWMAMIVCAIYFCIPAESREQFHDLQGGGLINSLEIQTRQRLLYSPKSGFQMNDHFSFYEFSNHGFITRNRGEEEEIHILDFIPIYPPKMQSFFHEIAQILDCDQIVLYEDQCTMWPCKICTHCTCTTTKILKLLRNVFWKKNRSPLSLKLDP